MKTIIHDLKPQDLKRFEISSDHHLINACKCQNHCIGCFSCWIKHPKECIHKDEYIHIVDFIKESDELIIISKSRFGSYSHEVKMILERCLGYVLPYFTIRNHEMHHSCRYDKHLKINVYFYGTLTDQEKKNAIDLVKANCINFNCCDYKVNFIDSLKEVKNVCLN